MPIPGKTFNTSYILAINKTVIQTVEASSAEIYSSINLTHWTMNSSQKMCLESQPWALTQAERRHWVATTTIFLIIIITLFTHSTNSLLFQFSKTCLLLPCITQAFLPVKTRGWIWMKFCLSIDVGTGTNWLIFEPDPDHSLDPGTGFTPDFLLLAGYLKKLWTDFGR